MNCEECLEQLQRYLDGDAPPAGEDLHAHALGCPACAGRLAAARKLAECLHLLKAPSPPALLAARVVAGVYRDRRRRRLRRAAGWVAALAAALVVAVGLRAARTGPGPAETGRTPLPARADATTPDHPTAAPVQPLRQAVAEAREAVASLTSRTADQAVGQTRFLLPAVSGPALPGLDLPPADSPARELRAAGEGLTAGLDPVASSARRAVDLFFRDLPAPAGQARRGS